MNPYEFEQKIKAYIEESGRSQASTARKLGVQPDTFNKWVRGVNQMPVDILHNFCNLVGLDESKRTELFKLAGYVVSPVVEVESKVTRTSTQESGSSLPPVPLPDKPYRDLIGRDKTVADMLEALRDPVGKRMIAVDGMGGIGKTALAREVVERCLAEQLFDVVAWIQAPKEEFIDLSRTKKAGTLTFDIILDTVARQLGALDVVKQRGTEKEARLRTLLQMQSVLVVLDNLETAKDPQNEIARRLLPLLGPSKAILTSRRRFQGELYAIHLTGLDQEGSISFIHQEAEEKNINRVATAGINELKQIAQDTGGSPLALKLVVGQLESLDLGTVLTLLRDVQVPEQGSEEDEYFRFYQGIFFSSWKLLSEKSQMLLISMSHFAPGMGGTPEAIQATSQLENPTLAHCIRELWRFSFLEVGESPTLKQIRYYLHALTQYFVLADIVKVI
jgi:transcriptional regulator with XRE-family HTH domain